MLSRERNLTIDLPRPVKGKRVEKFQDEKKVYTNIYGKRIPMVSEFRFIGEYEFGHVTTDIIDKVVSLYNSQSVCIWIPHKDFIMVNYQVVIKEINPTYLNGIVSRDTLIMKVESINLLRAIPTIDNMIKATLLTRVCALSTGEG